LEGIDEDENDDANQHEIDPKPPKHVHFNEKEDGNDREAASLIITEIPANPDHAILEEDAKKIWYSDFDYKRFEKDRILTSLDYSNARMLNRTFVEDEHSVRGLEHLYDGSLQRRQIGERKDLYKALKAEEARQKEAGCFPDLDKFRAISLKHTKGGRERARTKALEDAKEQQNEMRRSASMRNLFGMTTRNSRSQSRSQSRQRRRQSIG
jgi:hypothetical protein